MSVYGSYQKASRLGKIDPGRGLALASAVVLAPQHAGVCPPVAPSRPEGTAESVYKDYMNLCDPNAFAKAYDLETDLQRMPDMARPLRQERVSLLTGENIHGTVQTEGQNRIVKNKPVPGQFQAYMSAFAAGNTDQDAHYF